MLDSLVRVSRRVAAYADLLGREWPTATERVACCTSRPCDDVPVGSEARLILKMQEFKQKKPKFLENGEKMVLKEQYLEVKIVTRNGNQYLICNDEFLIKKRNLKTPL